MASTEAAQTTQEIALRAVPVPSFLQEVGVKMALDEETGARLLLFPDAVRQVANVIDPVSSLCQADPNWSPRISVAHLNPDPDNGPHFYKQKSGKVAPTKQALEVLAKAAGIVQIRSERIHRDYLDAEEPWAYRGIVVIRRSDGTTEEISAERTAGTDALDKEHGREKTETKAKLRAIRAALQIPHTFSPADAAKPFLVVGFNFTPDYNDVEVKRALIAAGLGSEQAMYGSSRELPSGDGSDLTHATVDAQQASPPLSPPVGGEAPGNPDAEPAESETGQSGYNLPQRALEELAAKAANFVPPRGVHADAGRTLQQIIELGNDGRKWFGAALRAPSDNESYTDALWAFARVHLPELADAVEAEKETQL